jgi:hypothetical protein
MITQKQREVEEKKSKIIRFFLFMAFTAPSVADIEMKSKLLIFFGCERKTFFLWIVKFFCHFI